MGYKYSETDANPWQTYTGEPDNRIIVVNVDPHGVLDKTFYEILKAKFAILALPEDDSIIYFPLALISAKSLTVQFSSPIGDCIFQAENANAFPVMA